MKTTEDILKENEVFDELECNQWMLDAVEQSIIEYANQKNKELIEALTF